MYLLYLFYSVYDKNRHLCAFDTGLIEKNVVLYFSGYMKPIYEENACPEGGVPAKDMGPINEWWVSGFDGGELALVGFTTAFAEYILMEPAEPYAVFMDSVKDKIYMSKIVIEFLLDEINPTYEDLLNKLQVNVSITRNSLAFYIALAYMHLHLLSDYSHAERFVQIYRRLFVTVRTIYL